ncbi:unnamed protein product [Pleuronectes platessa]|uniref:Uncharacterized protein n=1 Tax=Pleuronectes platessa TaxID=8262 RepID=A0A9N7VNI2_PLEPL|nr:unnamed protein product [Pleuronectes platessa]
MSAPLLSPSAPPTPNGGSHGGVRCFFNNFFRLVFFYRGAPSVPAPRRFHQSRSGRARDRAADGVSSQPGGVTLAASDHRGQRTPRRAPGADMPRRKQQAPRRAAGLMIGDDKLRTLSRSPIRSAASLDVISLILHRPHLPLTLTPNHSHLLPVFPAHHSAPDIREGQSSGEQRAFVRCLQSPARANRSLL